MNNTFKSFPYFYHYSDSIKSNVFISDIWLLSAIMFHYLIQYMIQFYILFNEIFL